MVETPEGDAASTEIYTPGRSSIISLLSDTTAIVFFICILKRIFDRPTADCTYEEQNQLSWQSAAWAILAIALANMADVPARMGGYTTTQTFYMKASPLICLCSVLSSLETITVTVLEHGISSGFPIALNQISVHKFGRDGIISITDRPVRMILFLFGGVTQAIKLYACKGIITLQLLVSFYILDFVLDEMILLWAQTQDPIADAQHGGAESTPSRIEKRLTTEGLSLDNIWAQSTMMVGMGVVSQQKVHPGLVFLIIGISLMLCGFLPPFVVTPILRRKDNLRHRVYSEFLLTLKSLLIMLVTVLIMPKFITWIDDGRLAQAATIFLLAILGVLSLNHFLRLIWQETRENQSLPRPLFVPFIATLMNIFCWTAFTHDAAKTYRPSWVDWLG